MDSLRYLTGYPLETLHKVQKIIDDGGLGEILLNRYPSLTKFALTNNCMITLWILKCVIWEKLNP